MIRFYFGSPGCGKTTLLIKLSKKARKKSLVHINFDHKLPGAYICDLVGLGTWTFSQRSRVFMDESGIEHNSRAYKSMLQAAIAWYKKHRHYRVDLDLFSQAWGDTDKILRDMASELWYLKKIGPWTLARRIYKYVMVDENTHQIIDGYRFASKWWLLFWFLQLGWPFDKQFTLTFRPFYYKYFDSWLMDDLPVKKFDLVPYPEKKRRKLRAKLDLAPAAGSDE